MSNQFFHLLKEKIINKTSIPFSEFMSLVLYHPNFGYYCRKNMALGKDGDFITAPEYSHLFAECIAESLSPAFLQNLPKSFLELGPGRGKFAFDFIQALEKRGIYLDTYYLYDVSPSLIHQQQILLNQLNTKTQFKWLVEIPENFSGIIFANELFDALPCERFKIKPGKILRQMVSFSGNECVPIWQEAFDESKQQLIQQIAEKYQLPIDYESEISFSTSDYFKLIVRSLKKGIVLFADYGTGEKQYYHPFRKTGSLRCFFQHQVHDNPFIHLGEQDITLDVNFSDLAQMGLNSGLNLLGYTTQAGFLLENHLLALAEKEIQLQTELQKIQMQQAIKRMTMPTEMGERIKFIAWSKNLDVNISGFQWQDRRMEL